MSGSLLAAVTSFQRARQKSGIRTQVCRASLLNGLEKHKGKVVLIDNYDSFTYNLSQVSIHGLIWCKSTVFPADSHTRREGLAEASGDLWSQNIILSCLKAWMRSSPSSSPCHVETLTGIILHISRRSLPHISCIADLSSSCWCSVLFCCQTHISRMKIGDNTLGENQIHKLRFPYGSLIRLISCSTWGAWNVITLSSRMTSWVWSS